MYNLNMFHPTRLQTRPKYNDYIDNDLLYIQKELIREVEMGPFKHTVDDGLDIRKVSNFMNIYVFIAS